MLILMFFFVWIVIICSMYKTHQCAIAFTMHTSCTMYRMEDIINIFFSYSPVLCIVKFTTRHWLDLFST